MTQEPIEAVAARLRTEAESRRHLDLPMMSVRPSDMLRLLDALPARLSRKPRPARED